MNNKIDELRKKINKQSGEDKNPCPTEILFYIASGRQAFKGVDPWYGQVKQLAGDADRHFTERQQAAIYGMYPELEPACKYFDQKMQERFERYQKCDENDAQKIEKDTLKKFGLKSQYSFLNPTEEQKEEINKRQQRILSSSFDRDMQEKTPVVQAVGQMLKNEASNMDKLTGDMTILNIILTRGSEWLKENMHKFSDEAEEVRMAEKIFELQDRGVVGKNFQIDNYKEFKQSSLVQDMQYEGKSLNLEKKVCVVKCNNPKREVEYE